MKRLGDWWVWIVLVAFILFGLIMLRVTETSSDEQATDNYRLGTPVTHEIYEAWDISVFPDGTGLPVGSGTAANGKILFEEHCAICHGSEGGASTGYPIEGPNPKNYPVLVGGFDSLTCTGLPQVPESCTCPYGPVTPAPYSTPIPTPCIPNKTVGSYWPTATTLFDYIQRAMPFWNPQSLSPDEVYSLSAYILSLNGYLPDDGFLDQSTLPDIVMVNRDGFIPDPRPETNNTRCMQDCAPLDP